MAAAFLPRYGYEKERGHSGSAVRAVDAGSPRSAAPRYLPPGWPSQVSPPETPDWERSASAFLLDCCPSDYRAHQVLRRHPVVLARLAAQFVESQIRASRTALSEARVGLGAYVTPDVLDSTIEVLQVEEARLVRVRRGVLLVEEALRGKVFLPGL